MINQIYHTSHCGSTLLISLLKESAISYAEPSWTHNVIQRGDNFFRFINEYDNGIIKLPSGLCNYAYQTEGKKIFLYRKLKQHLTKILYNYRINYIDYYYPYFRKNIHPSLKNIEFDTINKINIFLWANRIMWIFECKNIFWVESNEFFMNKQETLNNICDYLDIDRVTNFELANVNVKSIGMNHNNIDLNSINFDPNIAKNVDSDYGIIPDKICYDDHMICELLEWTRNNLPFIPEYLL